MTRLWRRSMWRAWCSTAFWVLLLLAVVLLATGGVR